MIALLRLLLRVMATGKGQAAFTDCSFDLATKHGPIAMHVVIYHGEDVPEDYLIRVFQGFNSRLVNRVS